VAFYYMFPDYFSTFLIFLPLIFYVVMGVFHGILIEATRKPVKKFPSRFLTAFGAKILILLVFIITYAYFNPSIAVPFLVSFLILYIFYTAFEITTLFRFMKRQSG
jgi:hypothetical protein